MEYLEAKESFCISVWILDRDGAGVEQIDDNDEPVGDLVPTKEEGRVESDDEEGGINIQKMWKNNKLMARVISWEDLGGFSKCQVNQQPI